MTASWQRWLGAWSLVAAACVIATLRIDLPLAHLLAPLAAPYDGSLRFVTEFGNSTYYLLAGALVFLVFQAAHWKHAAWAGAFLFSAVAISGLAADLIKLILGRARPKAVFADPALYGFHLFGGLHSPLQSTPSGHATTMAAVATVATILVRARQEPRWDLLVWLMVPLVAASRMALAAHFLSDVVLGIVFGSFVTVLLAPPFRKKIGGV